MLNKSLSGIDATKDFLNQELPGVIREVLMWHGVYSFLLAVLAVALFICSFVCMRYVFKEGFSEKYSLTKEDIKNIARCIFSFIATFIGLMIFDLTWLQIYIAPKVWLIEYSKTFVK